VINEKTKQQKYAMTPEMHNKTYAERQGFGQGQASMICNTQPSQHKNMGMNSIITKQQNAMGITIGS